MNNITTKHLIFIIIGLGIVSLKTYPAVLIKDGGRDTYLAVTAATIVMIILCYMFFSICFKKNNFNLVSIYSRVCGKRLGKVLIFFLILTAFSSLVECSAVEANSLHTNLLLNTPAWFFILLFIAPAAYSVSKGYDSIIIITLITISLIMVSGINLFILSLKYKNLNYLLPVMVNGITPGLIYSFIKTLGYYGCLFLALVFSSSISDKGRLKKHILIGLIIVGQMAIVSMIGIIATFGPERAAMMNYPKLIQTQEISYFSFIEGGEFFVMLQILGGWYIKFILIFCCILKLLEDINFKSNKNIYIISLLAACASIYIGNNIFIVFKYLNIYAYISLINYLVIPLLIFTVFSLKRGDSHI